MSEQQNWLYTDADGTQQGPVTAADFQQLAQSGTINAETSVWTDGLEEWISASQVEGLLPAQTSVAEASAAAEHVPQINLGAGSGIHLGSTIQAKPMGQSLQSTYNQPAKSPAKKIIFSIIAIAVIGTAIYFATQSNDESGETPGLAEYTQENERLSTSPDHSLFGNSQDSRTIGINLIAALDPPLEDKEEATDTAPEDDTSFDDDLHTPVGESQTDSSKDASKETLEEPLTASSTKLNFALICHTRDEDNQKSVIILIKLPTLHELDPKAKKALFSKIWVKSKLSLANTPYSDAKTTLVVALRGLTAYDEILTGNPLLTESPEKNPMEGMTKAHTGKDIEKLLYPYFVKKKY